MLEALQKGDEIVTAGGVLGRISKLGDQYLTDRDRPGDRSHGAARRRRAAAPQGHDQGAVTTSRPAAAARSISPRRTARRPCLIPVPAPTRPFSRFPRRHESIPSLEVPHHRRRARGRHPVHHSEFLSGSAGRPGVVVEGDGEDRQRASRHGRGCPQGGGHSLSRRDARRHGHQAALRRSRHAAQGEGRAASQARGKLHRRVESAVRHAALADGDRRAADVSRPRSARRRAFPAAGRHEGGARQGRGPLHHRHPLAAARKEGPVLRRRARRNNVAVRFRDEAERTRARGEIEKAFPGSRHARGRGRRRASSASSAR